MQIQEKPEKNVLLLSMSILNENPDEYYYESAENKYRFCGISQLEVGTKYFLRWLQKDNKKLDKIIIIESSESRNIYRNVTGKITMTTEANGKDSNREIKMTAVQFYKERIKQYIRGEEKPCDEKPNSLVFRKKILEFEGKMKTSNDKSLEKIYPDIDTLFEDIEVDDTQDETAIYQSINKLYDKIRMLKDNDTTVNLYLDMQGARRYETFLINAAVKMLGVRDIKVEKSTAIAFSIKNNADGRYNQIVDTTINDRIFEMVSGMNEFIKTGRGDTLQQFWQEFQNNNSSSLEQKIIEQIQNISDAIALCDVEGFDQELKTFSEIINEYQNNCDEKQKNQLFKSLVVDLWEDYEKYQLMSGKGAVRALNQIEWCLSKKLYQQALTIQEAKIPDALVDGKILYYGEPEQLRQLVNELFSGYGIVPGYMKQDKQIKEGNEKFIFIKYLFDKMGGQNEDGSLVVNSNSKLKEKLDKITDYILSDTEEAGKIGELLKSYHELADLRNNTNHATGEGKNVNQLKDMLETFIKLYREILEQNISLDYSKIRPLKSTLK